MVVVVVVVLVLEEEGIANAVSQSRVCSFLLVIFSTLIWPTL